MTQSVKDNLNLHSSLISAHGDTNLFYVNSLAIFKDGNMQEFPNVNEFVQIRILHLIGFFFLIFCFTFSFEFVGMWARMNHMSVRQKNLLYFFRSVKNAVWLLWVGVTKRQAKLVIIWQCYTQFKRDTCYCNKGMKKSIYALTFFLYSQAHIGITMSKCIVMKYTSQRETKKNC